MEKYIIYTIIWRHTRGFIMLWHYIWTWAKCLGLVAPPDFVKFWFLPSAAIGAEGYRQISNISRTKFQNLNVSHLVLQLSFPHPFKARR